MKFSGDTWAKLAALGAARGLSVPQVIVQGARAALAGVDPDAVAERTVVLTVSPVQESNIRHLLRVPKITAEEIAEWVHVEPAVVEYFRAELDGSKPLDHAAIALALAGDPVRLMPPERRECVRLLTEREWSAEQIAEQLGCAPRTVVRIRTDLTKTANKPTPAARRHNEGKRP
ncbi:helix-turn-helix domain-containing protein [Pseudoclavibacter helvolus]|uniref:helix-turn-helix domain-containing protein n=1 Tax=Pseudoclavibacter helvolus TaxID=255205 RepID=UPI0037363743